MKITQNPFFYRHAGPKGPEEASIAKKMLVAREIILEILEILEILLQTIKIAGDRPPRYGKK